MEVMKEGGRSIKRKREKVVAAAPSGKSSSSVGAAGQAIADCQDLMQEIFFRLPPRSLARCKSVSKQWRTWLRYGSFLLQHQARNHTLVGFIYNSYYLNYQLCRLEPAAPISLSIPFPHNLHGVHNRFLGPLNSSNGLILLYNSYFGKANSSFIVYNPSNADYAILPAPPSLVSTGPDPQLRTKRFLVYGFAFDPYSINPGFTVAELADNPSNSALQVNIYSSITKTWTTNHYIVEQGRNLMLFGPSVFFRGGFHWLLEPSGVLSYNIRSKRFGFLVNIPGDSAYIDTNGYCNCVRRMMADGLDGYSQCKCTCRHLGEWMDHLLYVRVSGDSEFSLWVLNDYCRGIWSPRVRIAINNLPDSLFYGKFLAFDRKNNKHLFFRVKRKIFSYNMLNGELNEVCNIEKKYGEDDICPGFILPYEIPTRSSSGVAMANAATDTNATETSRNTYAYGPGQPNTPYVNIYRQECNAELLRVIYHVHGLPWINLPNNRPFQRNFAVASADNKNQMLVAERSYNDSVRLEASIYGFLGGRRRRDL